MDQLIEFEAENGHMFVPFNYKEKNGLGRFVSNTRQHRKTSKIKDDVIAKLDSIGFVWVVPKGPAKDELVAWGKHFRWLKNFWETKGHCNVPANIGGEAVPTAKWCDEQRQLHLHGKLEKGRFERLSRLGFDFFGDGSSDDEQKVSQNLLVKRVLE